MILDKLNEFAAAASVAGAAGTANIGDVIDLGEAGRDLGNGEPLYLHLTCDTSIITGGAAGTIQFKLVSDSTSTPATDGSATEHWSSPVFVTDDDALNDIDANTMIAMVALPLNGLAPYERYLGLQAVIGTTTVTAGAVTAGLTLDPRGWKAHPNQI